jgi:hypothetical protein
MPPILELITLTSRRFDVAFWHIATFRCAAEFGRYRCITDSGAPKIPVFNYLFEVTDGQTNSASTL